MWGAVGGIHHKKHHHEYSAPPLCKIDDLTPAGHVFGRVSPTPVVLPPLSSALPAHRVHSGRSRGVSFYLVPHYQENAFHLHNDNFLPITSSILSTPCLCHGTELASCTRYEKVGLEQALARRTCGVHGWSTYTSSPGTWTCVCATCSAIYPIVPRVTSICWGFC